MLRNLIVQRKLIIVRSKRQLQPGPTSGGSCTCSSIHSLTSATYSRRSWAIQFTSTVWEDFLSTYGRQTKLKIPVKVRRFQLKICVTRPIFRPFACELPSLFRWPENVSVPKVLSQRPHQRLSSTYLQSVWTFVRIKPMLTSVRATNTDKTTWISSMSCPDILFLVVFFQSSVVGCEEHVIWITLDTPSSFAWADQEVDASSQFSFSHELRPESFREIGNRASTWNDEGILGAHNIPSLQYSRPYLLHNLHYVSL